MLCLNFNTAKLISMLVSFSFVTKSSSSISAIILYWKISTTNLQTQIYWAQRYSHLEICRDYFWQLYLYLLSQPRKAQLHHYQAILFGLLSLRFFFDHFKLYHIHFKLRDIGGTSNFLYERKNNGIRSSFLTNSTYLVPVQYFAPLRREERKRFFFIAFS